MSFNFNNLSKRTKIIIGAVVGVLVVAGVVGGSIAIANAVKKNKQAKCEHIYDEGQITVEATCETDGVKLYTCSECDYELVEEIPANGHVESIIEAVPATCTAKGLTDGIKCVTCEKVLVAPVEVPMLGHKVTALKAVAATCTTSGKTEGSMCSRCGEILKEQTVIPASGHTVVEMKGYAATCTETGKTNGSMCSGCGTVYAEQETIPMLEHQYVSGSCTFCGAFDLEGFVEAGNYTEVEAKVGDSIMGKVIRVYGGTDTTKTRGFTVSGADPMAIGYAAEALETTGATTASDTSQEQWDLSLYVKNGIEFIIGEDYVDIYFPEGGVIDFLALSFPDDVSYMIIAEDSVIGKIFTGNVYILEKK